MSIYSDYKKIFEYLSAGLVLDSVRFVSKEWHQYPIYIYMYMKKERRREWREHERKWLTQKEVWRDSFYQNQMHCGDPSSGSTRTSDASPKQVIDHLSYCLFTMRLSQTTEMVTTLAGSSQGLKDGKGSNASFRCPWGMCHNAHNQCVYICDWRNNSIRRLTMEGTSCFKITPLRIVCWKQI